MLTNHDMQIAAEALEKLVSLAYNSGLMSATTMARPPEERDGVHLDEEQEVFKSFEQAPSIIEGPTVIANLRRACAEGHRSEFTAIVKASAELAASAFK